MKCLQAGSHQASLRNSRAERRGAEAHRGRAGRPQGISAAPGPGRRAECCRPGTWSGVERPNQVGLAAEGPGGNSVWASVSGSGEKQQAAGLGRVQACSRAHRGIGFAVGEWASVPGSLLPNFSLGTGKQHCFPKVSPRDKDAVSRASVRKGQVPRHGLPAVSLDLSRVDSPIAALRKQEQRARAHLPPLPPYRCGHQGSAEGRGQPADQQSRQLVWGSTLPTAVLSHKPATHR